MVLSIGVGSDYWVAENFRVQHMAPLNYSAEDLEADRESADRLLKRLRSTLSAKTSAWLKQSLSQEGNSRAGFQVALELCCSVSLREADRCP